MPQLNQCGCNSFQYPVHIPVPVQVPVSIHISESKPKILVKYTCIIANMSEKFYIYKESKKKFALTLVLLVFAKTSIFLLY